MLVGAGFSSFEELKCCQVCRELRILISNWVKTLPPYEIFRLADDMLRAARSATRNIAEGFGRYHCQENIRFCRHTRGSFFELLDRIITCRDDGLMEEADYRRFRTNITDCLARVNGYINYLRR